MEPLNFTPFPSLVTERLLLRELKKSDDELMFNYFSNKENFPYVDMPVYNNLEEVCGYIEKMNAGVKENKWIIWAIVDKETDRILGTISIWNFNTDLTKAELGYGLFPGNNGKGIMSEALKKVIEYGFSTLGLKKLEAYTNILNDPSILLLKRNGFTKKSIFTEKWYSNGNGHL